MTEREIKIKDLAIKLNRSQSATGSLFRQENMSLETLNEIANALGYNMNITFDDK